MKKGKRYTCVECEWYDPDHGPIGSCSGKGYLLQLEDFCRVPGNPMMIRGPKTWVPTWCHKFWTRKKDSDE